MHFTANSNGENVPVAFNQSFICNSAQCVWRKSDCTSMHVRMFEVFFSFIETWGASKYLRMLKDQRVIIDG